MLFYVLYVIFCWVTMYYYISIIPNLNSNSLISSYGGSIVRFLAISAIRILHPTQRHPPSNSPTPRSSTRLYPLGHSPKHTAISFGRKMH
jgi:hypothetical protein